MENLKLDHKMEGGKGKPNYEFIVQLSIIAILSILLVYNGTKIYVSQNGGSVATGLATVSASEIIPRGVPDIYGKELGVSFDDVSPNNPALADATIKKLTAYEDMQLSSALMQRYVRIGSSIACEYCCGAQSLVFNNGERACGCAHSYAMRGLAKYLLTNNPDMSDEQILSELGKWKVLFFPGVHEQKAAALKAQGIDATDYINLASNKYRGIEQGQTSGGSVGQVGGC